MIDPAKLAALSLETLQALADSVKLAIAKKQRQEIGFGSEVLFYSKSKGRTIRMCVDNFGPKNLLGHEIDASGNHLRHMKWRAHPSLCKLASVAVPVKMTAIGGINDRPLSPGTF